MTFAIEAQMAMKVLPWSSSLSVIYMIPALIVAVPLYTKGFVTIK